MLAPYPSKLPYILMIECINLSIVYYTYSKYEGDPPTASSHVMQRKPLALISIDMRYHFTVNRNTAPHILVLPIILMRAKPYSPLLSLSGASNSGSEDPPVSRGYVLYIAVMGVRLLWW